MTQTEICFEQREEGVFPLQFIRPFKAGEATQPDLSQYDRFLLMMSGGKDSLACVLHLLEQGVGRDKIELHHHDVDGREGSTISSSARTTNLCLNF